MLEGTDRRRRKRAGRLHRDDDAMATDEPRGHHEKALETHRPGDDDAGLADDVLGVQGLRACLEHARARQRNRADGFTKKASAPTARLDQAEVEVRAGAAEDDAR